MRPPREGDAPGCGAENVLVIAMAGKSRQKVAHGPGRAASDCAPLPPRGGPGIGGTTSAVSGGGGRNQWM